MNRAELKLYRTHELTPELEVGICRLFEEIFHKNKSVAYFKHQFLDGDAGEGYHCLAELDGEVVGAFSCIPYRFRDEKEQNELLMAVCVDAMVAKRAKLGPLGIRFMFEELKTAMTADGVRFVYSFPNDNFYAYNVKIMGMRDIGILDFYMLPIAPGGLIRWLRFLDSCTNWNVRVLMKLAACFASSRTVSPRFHVAVTPAFRRQRYDERHFLEKLPCGSEIVYTFYEEERYSVAYVLDIAPLSPRALYEGMARVAQAARGRAAVVAFPSQRLPFGRLLRIPQRFLPRKLHMVGCSLGTPELDEEIFDLSRWNSNLAIFDVR